VLFAIGGVLVVLAFTAGCYVLGRLVTATLGGSTGLAASLAAPAGASMLGLELWAFGAIRVPWNPLTLLLPPAILVFGGRSRLWQALRLDLEGARAWWRDGRPDRAGDYLFLTVLVVFLPLFLWALVVQPLEGNDAIALWMFKAKLYLAQGRVDLGAVISESGRNLAYPPLYSLVADSLFVLTGGASDNLGKAVAFPFVLAAPLTMLAATARLGRRRTSALFVALVVTLPLGLPHILFDNYMGYADYPLAVMVLLVVACVARAEATRDPRDYHLALLAAAIAAVIKNEGQVLLVTTAAITLFRLGRPGISGARARTLGMTALASVPVAAWKLVAATSGYHSQSDDLGRVLASGLLSRALYVLDFALHVTSFTNDLGWILVAAVLVLEFTLLNRSPSLSRAAVLVVLAQIAGYFITYLVFPFDLNWVLSSSFDRLTLQITPALILLLALGTAVQATPPTELSDGSP
jgi:hypothetical protein